MMRSTGNFSPEWGYLAPAPSLLRTMRIVLVATAIGATAGAGVVLSLLDRPTSDSDKVVVAAHAIVTSAQAAPVEESQAVNGAAVVAPLAAAAKAETGPHVAAAPTASPAPPASPMQAAAQAQQVHAAVATSQTDQGAQAQALSTPASVANAAPTRETSAASVAELSEAPTAAATSEAPTVTSDAGAGDQAFVGPQQLPQQKKPKHHIAVNNNRDFIGAALRRFFSARAGGPFYPSRGL